MRLGWILRVLGIQIRRPPDVLLKRAKLQYRSKKTLFLQVRLSRSHIASENTDLGLLDLGLQKCFPRLICL